MSNWDREYHRKSLEETTGQKWYPSGNSMTRCAHDLARANRILGALRSIERLIMFTQLMCLVSIGGGIAVGVLDVYRTVGPTTVLILPAAVIFLAGIGARIPLTIYAIDKAELEVIDREEAYDVSVQKEIAS